MGKKRSDLNVKAARNKTRRLARNLHKSNTAKFRKQVQSLTEKLEGQGLEALRTYAMEIGIPYGLVYGENPPKSHKLKKRIVHQRLQQYHA